jgi:UDP-N-acetylmuramoyl-tripeptide--D-alanyl-D-alanine ligase
MTNTESLYEYFKTCTGISTDTRKIEQNAMFFALKGPNFDANTMAAKAIELGASFAVIDNPAYQLDERFLLVNDTLRALQDLALHHRRTLNIPVIGLTGSNGKTTTKELLNAVLSKQFNTYATVGNLNNHIGVPLSILEIDSTITLAIIEMGANKQGDIKELVEICEPTHGLINNVGKAHLEGFGGIEGVEKGKGELYDFLEAKGGVVFVNGTLANLVRMAKQRNFTQKISYQTADGFSNIKLMEEIPTVVFEAENGQKYHSPLTGAYNFDNIATALCVSKFFGMDTDTAARAAAAYSPTNNRSQMIERNGNHILMDAYNANPSSMEAAIRNFDQLKTNKKMVILADMFELGNDAPTEHAALGQLIANCHFDTVLLVGQLMQHTLVYLPKAFYFPDKFGLHVWLQDHPIIDTHILVKGSRGMKLESVLDIL